MNDSGRVVGVLLTLLFVFGFIANAGAQAKKLNIAYTATSPYQAVLIIAQDAGFLKKHNLDVSLIFTAGGSLGIQAMVGGDVAMAVADGSSSVAARLSGVDVMIIASFLNTFPYSLVSLPEIKKVNQLAGGKIAVSRFGSATDLGVRMALAKVGLNAEKDVTLLQIGAQTARFAALQSRNVQGTIITPPFTLTSRKLGFNTLIDMAELNIPFQLTALLASRSYLKRNPEVVTSVIQALTEGIHFYKKEKEASIKIVGKYLKTDDREALEETYREIALKVVPEKPYPTLAGVQTILDELGKKNPKAKASRPEDFVDSSFVKKIDDAGFIDRLYKR
ncbi:MAG: ABC transporter substrate-binding protein [Deltaproteobacteria bacterium]|nr:ABC transporter substrate-binding protein [Deltaproteobacteria bacterium]